MISSISGYGAYGSAASSLYNGTTRSQRPDRSEMQEKLFSKVDSSGDGNIDETELNALLTRDGSVESSIDAASALSGMDSNGDGSLSSDEFNAGAQDLLDQLRSQSNLSSSGFGLMAPPSAEDMAAQLMSADSDGDGKVSESELSAALSGLQGADGSTLDISELLSRIDTDGDGNISEDEALSDAESMVANGPGGMGGMGMMPPPPPPSDSSSSSSSSSDQQRLSLSSLLTQYSSSTGSNDSSAMLERLYSALAA